VHSVAAKARATYPALGGKIEHATALVLAGAVERPLPYGTHYTVASQSDPTGLQVYDVHSHNVNGRPDCTCEDFTRHATSGGEPYRCKHIVAVWLYQRARDATPAPEGEAPGWRAPVAPAPLPEAAFSLCLKGRLGGQEAQLPIRGATYAEFAANVDAVRGLLDRARAATVAATVAATAPTGAGWCSTHQVPMQHNEKEGRSWWSHKTAEGWCKGK
jgi:hypothetical protein